MMDKNYYDILEISKNASPEIIEKAYKTLVKKYHPDLQEKVLKDQYETKLKLINEAYETLSNQEKRSEYDAQLANYELKTKHLTDELLNENMNLKNELNHIKSDYNNISNDAIDYEKSLEYKKNIEDAKQKAYYDAYIQDLKNRGYKIKYKKSFKDYFKSFISIVLTILILFLLFHIPFIKNIFISMYNENDLLKILVDSFINLFK